MSFGQNLQFLRKMSNRMTQEELAEKLGVSRQTVSKWELDGAYPEMEKVIELCKLFSCGMDELIREDMNVNDEAYSEIRFEEVEAFNYIKYTVVSTEPEDDAISHVQRWAEQLKISEPQIIGWDFPVMSQELINVHNMHGYTAALILPENLYPNVDGMEVISQGKQRYIVITIKNPAIAPFRLIPNAYKILMTHMQINGMKYKQEKDTISSFEKEYVLNEITYMDVYIAIK